MKTTHVAAIVLSSVAFAFAAPPTPAPPKAPVPIIAQWEAVLAARERRANLIRDEIKAMDSRIEARGDALLESLRIIADSKDSRSKVARMKEATIEGIRNNIEYYRSKRAALKEELRRPTLNLTDAEKRTMMDAFDVRIEKRIGQIIEMLKSLPTHKDYERYTVKGSNWIGPVYAVNEDYVQNQRLVTITNRLKREIEADLLQGICFRARRAGNGQNADGRRGVRGYGDFLHRRQREHRRRIVEQSLKLAGAVQGTPDLPPPKPRGNGGLRTSRTSLTLPPCVMTRTPAILTAIRCPVKEAPWQYDHHSQSGKEMT